MTLAGTIAAVTMINSLLAVALAGTAARAVAVRGNRVAVEGEMALAAVQAVAVTTLASTGIADTTIGPFPLNLAGLSGEWTGSAALRSTANDTIWYLSLEVVSRDPGGDIIAARSGTLLLSGRAADTASVMEIR